MPPPPPTQETTSNCHAPVPSYTLAGQCSKSHKLTRQNCRRMPHKILMKNTSSKKKGRPSCLPPRLLLPACLLAASSICNKCDKLLKCTSQASTSPLSQGEGTKTKPQPKLMTRPASKSVVNCKWQRILY